MKFSNLLSVGLLLTLNVHPTSAADWFGLLSAKELLGVCTNRHDKWSDGYCAGYIMGIDNNVRGRPTSADYCPYKVPKGVQPQQLVDSVVKYLVEHPNEVSNNSATMAVTFALVVLYPCR
ncbi:MAG: hypothetical protein KIT25_06420 [Enhydrobacter sp.]|nr:MAG: hypothetical protein KIT25_06420 [Enhydrobacter sp.]